MKKRVFILPILILPALFMLTGCLRLTVDMGVDERLTSYLSYTIEMDVSETDPQYHNTLANALNNFGWYYQENYGFSVGVDTESDIYTLTMRKSAENGSFPEAFTSLESMITDEATTIFMLVDTYLEVLPGADSYFISAMVDIPKIIRLSSAIELPPDVLAQMIAGLESSGGTIFLTLPAGQIDGHSHEVNMEHRSATMAVPIDFTSQTELELRGSVVYSPGGMQIGSFEEIINENENTRGMVLLAGGSAILLLLIILLIILLRIRRHNKLYD